MGRIPQPCHSNSQKRLGLSWGDYQAGSGFLGRYISYPGLSAHFSGDGFSDMAFDLHAVTPEQFSAWATATSASGPVLDEAAYRNLLTQSKNLKPYTYRAVQRDLYGDIVSQKLPPGEGPPTVQEN